MMDRDRFADALLRALPKLERENTTVSLAYGNVLQQKKMPLLEGRPQKNKNLEPIPTRQVSSIMFQICFVEVTLSYD